MATTDHGRSAAGFLVFGLLLVAVVAGVAMFARDVPAVAGGASGTPSGSRRHPQADEGARPHLQPGPAAKPAGASDRSGVASAQTADAVLGAAETLLRQGEAARAEAVLAAAVREHVDDTELRLAHGRVLVQLGRPEEAYAAYEAALASGADGPEVRFEAGTIASMIRRRDRAIEHYSAAQAADPGDPRYPLYLAQVQRAEGDRAGARKNLLLSATLDDSQPVAWGTLAEMELEDNRPGVALQHVAKARALEPRQTVWRLIEARALKRQNDPGRALMVLEGVEGDDRASLAVLRLVGDCFALLGRPADAAARFVEAADREGATPELLFEAAAWLERAGDTERARHYARMAAMQGHEAARAMLDRFGG